MSEEYDMRRVAPTVCSVLGIRPPSSAETSPMDEVADNMGSPERLVVVVIDAFGVYTWTNVKMLTPTFNAIAKRHLLHIKSVMPTFTPVNFATMLTGASPENHEIMYRTEELKLETVFDVLRENGKTSATAARAMSSLGVLISPFADHPGLAESNTDVEVCALAVEALKKQVNLLWVQLLDVDDNGHLYGPLSSRGAAAAHKDDNHLRDIARVAYHEDYCMMVLADHGQHTIITEDGSRIGTHGTNLDEDVYVPFLWCTANEIEEALGF